MFKLFNKKENGKKVLLKIEGMHCVSCSMNIDMALEEVEGVENASTNYARSETEVIFDSTKTNLKKLQSVVEELGYKVLANQ